MSGGTAEEDVEAIRREAPDWLARHWDPAGPAGPFLTAVVDAGWAAPTWPEGLGGRSLPADAAAAVGEEFLRVGAPGSGQDRTNLWAGTVLAHGRPALARRLVPGMLAGRVAMCLLYSEPSAGSDLAGLRTTAVRDGDEWVVDGQKVWTSGARRAEWAFLLARTDWDVPKHAGLSFFLLPMRQPGVEVRPLRQATGDARFNEVFLTGARVGDDCLLGAPGEGWTVLQTALAYERAVMGRATPAARRRSDDADDEWAVPAPDLQLVDLARARGRAADPLVRQRLSALAAMTRVNALTSERAAGGRPELASLGKLAMSRILHTAAGWETALLGAEATVAGDGHERAADAAYSLHNAFFTSIGGGTDQIQRSIVGERVLGLPREPDPDRGRPFRGVAGGG